MIIKTLLPALFLSGFVSSANIANADGLKTAVNPEHLADTTQSGITDDGADEFESRVARSFNDLIAMVEAEGEGIEDIVKITLVVKYQDEIEPRYLVQTSPGRWRAYGRTR